MNIVIFTHPAYLGSRSMPKFANMVSEGMIKRGHKTAIWSPKPFFHRLPVSSSLKKWLGYIDEFLIFPALCKIKALSQPKDTIYVFCDQALGPWIPGFSHRPHAIHCHDFLALRSSLGEFPQNRTSWTGKIYQSYIRKGASHGRYFLPISEKTKSDLLEYVKPKAKKVKVILNGLNFPYIRIDSEQARDILRSEGIDLPTGFILHVGGNQWYKNRVGVIGIYSEYASSVADPLPLLLIGMSPSKALKDAVENSGHKEKIVFASGLSDRALGAAYSMANLLLFPSIAEGFGWPIIEAFSAGCPVLTTNDAPMTEVGGDVAFYLPKRITVATSDWNISASKSVLAILNRSTREIERVRESGYARAMEFDGALVIQRYEDMYREILQDFEI